MSFEILIHDNLSLVDLVEISKNGGVVLKTPHIGNIYPNNLLVISLGIPTLFYDRTLGSKDANFHPDKIILGGTYTSVADPNTLSTHATVTTVPDALNNFVKSNDIGVGTKLTDLHMSSIRHISPSGNCFTYSEYVGKNRELIFSILREVTEIKPGLWTRRVNTDVFSKLSKVN